MSRSISRRAGRMLRMPQHTAALIAATAIAAAALLYVAADAQQAVKPMGKGLTDVPGIKVGHMTLTERPTGCTVILAEAGAVAGVDVRGSAPGTIETDLLNPLNL